MNYPSRKNIYTSKETKLVSVEEDGDEIFTPIPTKCIKCQGKVKNRKCLKCGASY